MRLSRFASAFFATIIAVACEVQCKNLFGWSPDFVLATLLVLPFYLNVLELAFLAGVAALMMNWKPAPSFEIVLLLFLPLAAFGLKRLVPWRAEAAGLGILLAGLIIFYAVTFPSVIGGNPLFATGMLIIDAVFAGAVFYSFRYFYKVQ